MISKLYTIIHLLGGWIIYILSFVAPRDKNTWIFIGWHRNEEREIFADNSKYFFLYVANNLKEIRSIWIGEDKKICKILENKGYEAYYVNSIKGIYYSLRAGYTIIDAMMKIENWKYSGNSRTIQLWHGKGPKRIIYDSPYSLPKYNKIIYPNLFKKYDYLIASSNYTADFMAKSFRLKKDRVLITGLPKHDPLINNISGGEIDINMDLYEQIKKAKLKNHKKIILYAPTWRPDGTNPISKLKLKDLDNLLNKKGYFLIGLLHPKFSAQNWIPKEKFSNIGFARSGYDIYPLLSSFDLLITDYSSVSTDFLFMNKPTIYFVYDIEKYKKDMGLYEDFWNLLPGPRAYSFEELLGLIEMENNENRKIAQEKLFSFIDGNASKRIVEAISKKVPS
jgi:CDP-glycerol glycerophosphotransferase (TagB/SpsB family)